MSRSSGACIPHREASLSHPTVEIHLAQDESETRVDPRPIRAGGSLLSRTTSEGRPTIERNHIATVSSDIEYGR